MAKRFKSILIIIAFMNLLVFPFYVGALLPDDPYANRLTLKENTGIASCLSLAIMAEENNEEKEDLTENEDGYAFLLTAFEFAHHNMLLYGLNHSSQSHRLLNNLQTIYCPPESGCFA